MWEWGLEWQSARTQWGKTEEEKRDVISIKSKHIGI